VTDLVLRPAAPGDEPRLRAVAQASKAHWGYDRERVRRWADELDLSREIWIAEQDGTLVAWAALLPPDDGVCELDDLWVEPQAIGSGIGTSLFRHAAARARELGASALRWEADPNAVGFYERMGAATVDIATSSWGRTLPVMQVEL
jgi:N-acetylglutamate synthase-like GNAT family acetyltransferase